MCAHRCAYLCHAPPPPRPTHTPHTFPRPSHARPPPSKHTPPPRRGSWWRCRRRWRSLTASQRCPARWVVRGGEGVLEGAVGTETDADAFVAGIMAWGQGCLHPDFSKGVTLGARSGRAPFLHMAVPHTRPWQGFCGRLVDSAPPPLPPYHAPPLPQPPHPHTPTPPSTTPPFHLTNTHTLLVPPSNPCTLPYRTHTYCNNNGRGA